MPRALALALLASLAVAEEEAGLERPPSSLRARELREGGLKLWKEAEPLWHSARRDQPVEPAAVAEALAKIEDSVAQLERSLQAEWHAETNAAVAEAARAWHALRAKLPSPPLPDDPKERAKAEEAAARDRRQRAAEARRFVMEYGSARRYESQLERCDRCEGRKLIRSAFGDPPVPCAKCDQLGVRVVPKGLLAARWLPHSPAYRADVRNVVEMDRALRTAKFQTRLLAPFTKSVGIEGDVEDHDSWVRIRAVERIVQVPAAQKPEKAKVTYVLFRVGRVWYLWTRRYDAETVGVPAGAEEAW
ncbi:MAG: hypothetical protein ACREID_00725 [Planctomycetota bacterium]